MVSGQCGVGDHGFRRPLCEIEIHFSNASSTMNLALPKLMILDFRKEETEKQGTKRSLEK